MGYSIDYGTIHSLKVVLDPAGEKIALDGKFALKSVSGIPITDFDIDPTYSDSFNFGDVYVEFYDSEEFFNIMSVQSGKKLRSYVSSLYEAPSANYMWLDSTFAVSDAGLNMPKVVTGDVITVIDRSTGSYETIQVTDVDNSSFYGSGLGQFSKLQKVYFTSGALSGTYIRNDLVVTNSILGKRVDILEVSKGATVTETTVFRGILREMPEWRNGVAIVKLDNLFGLLLQADLKTHASSHTPIQRINVLGGLSASYSWTTQTGTGSVGGQLTHIDSDDQGNFAYNVWGDGTFVYVANAGGGILSYSVDGAGALTYVNFDNQGATASKVWGDGTYVYLANGSGANGGLHSYSVDGAGAFTHIDSDHPEAMSYAGGVWGDGTFLYLAYGSAGLHSYSVDGAGALTHIDSDDQGGNANNVWGDGTFLYLASVGLHSYSVDGAGALTHIDYDEQGGTGNSVWGDGTFLYLADGASGLHSYSVDGAGALTHIDTNDQGFSAANVWGDGTFVYVSNGAGGISVFSVDSAGLITHLDTDYQGDSALDVWGDGTFLYLANRTGGIHSYSVDYSYTGVTIYTGAMTEKWTITFTSPTAFLATGPGTSSKTGSTASNFFDGTDAADSQIQIPTGFWHGTPAIGDVLEFYICANFSNKTACQIIDELVRSYGGVSADLIEGNPIGAVANAWETNYGNAYTWSFSSQIKLGAAIITMLSPMLSLTTTTGKLGVSLIWPLPKRDDYVYGAGP